MRAIQTFVVTIRRCEIFVLPPTKLDTKTGADATKLTQYNATSLSLISLLVGYAKTISFYENLAKDFADLEQKTIGLKGTDAKKIESLEKQFIEIGKPIDRPLNALNLLCHNAVVDGYGYEKALLYKIPFYMRWTSHLKSWNIEPLKMGSEGKSQ